MKSYYIASCLFTARFPEVSLAIQKYIDARYSMDVVRCCIPNFRVKPNEERIPEGEAKAAWRALPTHAELKPGDTVYSLCHNCTNIVGEQHAGVQALSLWELIDRDEAFVYPDYSGLVATVQDCWRSREQKAEQDAVRSILRKMNIQYVETEKNRGDTDFCGSTLYREQPAKNAKYAPKHYVEQAEGKFLPHTEAEQIEIMREHCSHYATDTVICYCHYCLEGLLQGGVDGRHLAHLLLPGFEAAAF
ncbi:MAG: hypothetical protein IJ769_09730 [Clostridia bacterium]|nr:hypothetical protein [Clostridia bacterium]